ncbi:threonine-phosphate decarboxylase CobD [Rhodoblastus acidophilus]|uniref:threonine-phosphate decarboxylase n=1 Tax=Candidatus Rhodoblastus alkanivorans TaxID=2954117 RepID=A0ABS9Z3A6_9HYPH|nr:threonine-phosphate decarboxylase CobD [Candidatus Rhodoblastus alkanivorans]MCI4677409.1 threonine-phosphate decarboxylase CobD [Candidatus Rhodoblastus alkanivorans]MCI4682144.1 threonine-phosphate decarboxylase CobD [Candidatus Rhodoblastus alkanivorans]MDI4639446.1 threonine-phosphate decarboxylase CobD [Rhodoblastus acidophilus]
MSDGAIRSDVGALAYHGGGLTAARRLFPHAPEPWLDLSTGINPTPYPFTPPDMKAYARLPEAERIAALEEAAAQSFGADPAAGIVAAPGTQALIQLLPRVVGAKKIAVLGFTYSEHARVWAASGAEVTTCRKLDELAGADAAIVVNPNNPDGRLCDAGALNALAHDMGMRGRSLIVDEAFMDFLPRENSVAPLPPAPGLIVLRSFGKTFGLAGLRLGFALGDRAPVERMRAALGPWAVSGVAVEIGIETYQDDAWLTESAARLAEDCARLDALLRGAGFEILGGTPLFRLARHDTAREIFLRLCDAGVLTRPFAERPDWLRFGAPDGDADFGRLADVLASIHKANP